jgi:hypothetical protein
MRLSVAACSCKNSIRLMNTPLHPESMNNSFVLCINPQKMQVPGALYAWRCSHKDEYNSAGNLEERRGAMIVAIFANSKRDAPALKYANDDYYDRNFKHAEGKNNLLYISGGKIGSGGLLGVQNVMVVVQSDNMATVDKLFSGMDLKPVAQLVQ